MKVSIKGALNAVKKMREKGLLEIQKLDILEKALVRSGEKPIETATE